jgi:hypothetical protein
LLPNNLQQLFLVIHLLSTEESQGYTRSNQQAI